ncbi:MAG: HAD-IA family hydrolase [Proteobacteria bacterium]|uniref:HAD-IA family hydrolase n=1 Tax=Candidatus Avisuccinivibrio stercorigallinarum TaxID=2840704 RepID=A0A9D9D9W8_9GAMM|nr:HAD-IA family hydrolase [Candidatus Avisuccinivibrio stercorigallinarum]
MESSSERTDSTLPAPAFHAVLFDLDGTLLDTAPDLINACNATLEDFGYQKVKREQLLGQVTAGMRAMLSAAIPPRLQDPQLIAGPMRDYFASYYTSHICVDTKPFAGMDDLILKLHEHGVKTAVVTNKYYSMAVKLLEAFPFRKGIDAIVGGDSCEYAKPHPQPLCHACEVLQVKPEHTLYVGDHLNDVMAAKRAGIENCCVTWGYGALECGDPHAWNSDHYADAPLDLDALIFRTAA